ncbi:MAG: YjbF family lipoprotein, partial [Gammaproteobacteria bacterium]
MNKVNMLPAVFLISSCNSFVLTDPAIYINDYFFGFESDNVSAQAYSNSEYSFANIKIGRGPAANVVLAYINDGIYEWRSNDGIIIYTNNGIIVKTLGLEKDVNYGIDQLINFSSTEDFTSVGSLYGPDLIKTPIKHKFLKKDEFKAIERLGKTVMSNVFIHQINIPSIKWSA